MLTTDQDRRLEVLLVDCDSIEVGTAEPDGSVTVFCITDYETVLGPTPSAAQGMHQTSHEVVIRDDGSVVRDAAVGELRARGVSR